jgi:protein-L-isoaspartate(D-aspartate) O-methyltransferase
MGQMNRIQTNGSMEQMIQQQIIDRGISTPRVLDAIRATPREAFFPPDQTAGVYSDRPSPIGHGQTISQPYIVALMTDRLKLEPSHKVLEIGTGSGYQTALLARLCNEVYTVERIKPLLDDAWERLMQLQLRNVRFRHGDGSLGWPVAAPFDRILISAGAPELPDEILRTQLVDGGIAILPVGPIDRQVLIEIRREGISLRRTDICLCRFVKLIGEHAWEDDKSE